MNRRLLTASLTLFVLLLFHDAAHAQQGTALYVGPGRVLQAGSPRQLSLNAHVSGFLFQPGGLSVAYVGMHDEDGALTVTVHLVDARHSDPMPKTLFTVTGDAPDASVPNPHVPSVDLIGWTPDARYLILRQEDQTFMGAQYVSVDVGADPIHTRDISVPPPPQDSAPEFAWSPDHTRLLIIATGFQVDAQLGSFEVTSAATYNPANDQSLPVTVADGLHVLGWQDPGHLLAVRRKKKHGDKEAFFSHDLSTGTDVELAAAGPHVPLPGTETMISPSSADAVNPVASVMTLETQEESLTDAARVAKTPARTLWVRAARAPKALSAVSVGITPGSDDPQAAWSPSGKSVAFVAHGDLFVTDFTERDATPYEKFAAGEKLSCDEEKSVIMSNMKQIGLGIIQYSQDSEENFPPQTGWHDAVYPYLKDENLFQFAGVPVVYHAPANLSLASIDSPADTVLATAETPCAHIVLYVDGHVKAFDKGEDGVPPAQGQ